MLHPQTLLDFFHCQSTIYCSYCNFCHLFCLPKSKAHLFYLTIGVSASPTVYTISTLRFSGSSVKLRTLTADNWLLIKCATCRSICGATIKNIALPSRLNFSVASVQILQNLFLLQDYHPEVTSFPRFCLTTLKIICSKSGANVISGNVSLNFVSF